MAKKKKEKKEKTDKKKAKADAKQSRAADKKHKKMLEAEGERPIEDILREIAQEDAARAAVTEEVGVRPTPRVNFTLVQSNNKHADVFLFGGEYFNGARTTFFNDVYRYRVEKEEWRRYTSPTSPPPRGSHQAVVYKDGMYVFGGEFASPNQNQFHHFRDLWHLHLPTMRWERLETRGGPSARSGHRMTVWKNNIVLFGGFFDNLRETKYFNDLWLFSFDTYQWTEAARDPSGICPSPRSGFQMVTYGDSVFLYGGYSKIVGSGGKKKDKKDAQQQQGGKQDKKTKDSVTNSSGTVHTDLWRRDLAKNKWEKGRGGGNGAPSVRSGFGMALWKNRLVLFGGVTDFDNSGSGEKEPTQASEFHNELYFFNLDANRWHEVYLKAGGGGAAKKKKRRRGKKERERLKREQEKKEAGEDDDDDGNDDDEDDDEDDDDDDDEDDDDEEEDEEDDKAKQVAAANEPLLPPARMKPLLFVRGNALYLYGGLVEMNDREITLDDMYTLDLQKLDGYSCVLESTASIQEWIEEEDDDDDDDDYEDDDEDDDEEEYSDSEEEEERRRRKAEKKKADAAAAAGVAKGSRQRWKAREEGLLAEIAKEENERTPLPGESLAVFYGRTKKHWKKEAWEVHIREEEEAIAAGDTSRRERPDEKELRRRGHELASERYEEMRPVLEELAALEAEAAAFEAREREERDKKRAEGMASTSRFK